MADTGWTHMHANGSWTHPIGVKCDLGVDDSKPLLELLGDSAIDAVNHPLHYGGDTTYETIKVIEAWGLGFNLGNAVKYISRADHKGSRLVDLRKALFYLTREVERLEKS